MPTLLYLPNSHNYFHMLIYMKYILLFFFHFGLIFLSSYSLYAAVNCSICTSPVWCIVNIVDVLGYYSFLVPFSSLWLQYQLETTGTQWLKTDLVHCNLSKLLSWDGNDNWEMLGYTSENTSLAKIVWILTSLKRIDSF